MSGADYDGMTNLGENPTWEGKHKKGKRNQRFSRTGRPSFGVSEKMRGEIEAYPGQPRRPLEKEENKEKRPTAERRWKNIGCPSHLEVGKRKTWNHPEKLRKEKP